MRLDLIRRSYSTVEAKYFQLYKRAKHVLTESLRVLSVRALCLDLAATSTDPLPESTLHTLGGLLNSSQDSCSALFECSCPELDDLTRICRESGAYGSRLTGAGWGGCTISLVAENDTEGFISRVRAKYPPYQQLSEDKLKEAIFATHPSSGAFGELRL